MNLDFNVIYGMIIFLVVVIIVNLLKGKSKLYEQLCLLHLELQNETVQKIQRTRRKRKPNDEKQSKESKLYIT